MCEKLSIFNKIKRLIKSDNKDGTINYIVSYFMKYRSVINFTDEYGNTLLHYACRERKYKLIKLLLNNNADPTILNIDGRLPIHFAAIYGTDRDIFSISTNRKNRIKRKYMVGKMINVLLSKYPESIGIKDKTGHTPLEYFIVHSDLSNIDKLKKISSLFKCEKCVTEDMIYKIEIYLLMRH